MSAPKFSGTVPPGTVPDPNGPTCVPPNQGGNKKQGQAKFKTSSVVGLTVEEAEKELVKNGFGFRVMKENGEQLQGTCDFWPDRVNVAVENGVVTEIIGQG